MIREIVLRSNIFITFCFLAICSSASLNFSQTPEKKEITTLESGKQIEREIAGGEKQMFQINLNPNQYAKAIVNQRGIDVVVRLLDANNKPVVDFDSDPRINGTETIELTAQNAGNYQLTIEPKQKNAPKGIYQIRLTEVRAATAKDFALGEARKLLTESIKLWRAGDYEKAFQSAEKALAIQQREQGAAHPDFATVLTTIANIYSDQGDYEKAVSFYERSLEIKEKVLGKDDISLSAILNNLGTVYKDKGDYVKAEALFHRALAIREQWLEPNHLLIASVLNNLGILSFNRGDLAKAETYYRRTLEIREKALGPETAEVATSLNNLANIFSEHSKAEPLYLRALAIREKILPTDHPDIAQSLYNLATLYGGEGNYAKAEPLCRRAFEIFEKSLGENHPLTSASLNLLAVIHKNTGDFDGAVKLYQRAITSMEKSNTQYHPYLGGILANLANLYAVEDDFAKALPVQSHANSIYEFNTALNLQTGSENEKLDYLQTSKAFENQTLTLSFMAPPADSKEAVELGANIILQRKGRVLDAMADSLNILRRRFNKDDQLLLDKLNDTTKKLVGLIIDGQPNASSEDQTKIIKDLQAQRELLEDEISRQSAGFYEQTKSVTLEDVQKAIPKDAVLVEFAVYQPVSLKDYEFSSNREPAPNAIKEPHYAVFVIGQNRVASKDLGAAKEIDRLINGFRQALRDPQRTDIKKLARLADEKIMSPIRNLNGGAKHLLISPDGALNLIPFEALVDENNQYLVENYSLTYLTSGRDLLRMQIARESKNKPLVIANPLFGAPISESTVQTNLRPLTISRRKRQSLKSTRNLTGTYFAPLGGTAQEARSIQKIFPDATILTQAQATESALKLAVAPSILHIATHGFFLEDNQTDRAKSENPLLRSGLALAGANQKQNVADDGILTALEASGLNLWGTKLVVLSACDTGLGEVKNGEGVYGLRRAFALAGTESLVMSLWSVSDSATREIMTNYYKNLKQGAGRGASLREVQLEMLKRPDRRHPFYWASFIQSGEWANLEGKR